MISRRVFLPVIGLGYYLYALWAKMGTLLLYAHFDVDGAYLALLIFRSLRMLDNAFFGVNISWEEGGHGNEQTHCFVKSLYYAMFLWPQGAMAEHINNAVTYMIFDRWHWDS